MNTEKEKLIFKKRLLESAQLAYRKEIVVYTDFLGLAEQDLFYTSLREFPPVSYFCYGGTKEAERFCIAFDGRQPVMSLTRKEKGEEELFPIACVCISASGSTLTHRDYLGAILHLGIARSKLGDIFIQEQKAYVFCTELIGDFLCRELITVKHTQVHCEITIPEETLAPTLKEITGTVASLRLDALLSLAFQTSRSAISAYIEAGKTYVNGKLCEKSSYILKEEDIVSVRGKGRFTVAEVKNTTKKGRIVVRINKYIS